MSERYIGIKKGTKESPSQNLGSIWEKREDGKYYCVTSPNREPLEQWQINHDLNLKYLKREDGTSSTTTILS